MRSHSVPIATEPYSSARLNPLTPMAIVIPDSFRARRHRAWAYLYDTKGFCNHRSVLFASSHILSNVRIRTGRQEVDAVANEGSHATHPVHLGQIRPRSRPPVEY